MNIIRVFKASTLQHNHRLKYVDICYHFIRKYVKSKHVNIVYISTDDMIADILIKPLGRIKFKYFREGLGVGDCND